MTLLITINQAYTLIKNILSAITKTKLVTPLTCNYMECESPPFPDNIFKDPNLYKQITTTNIRLKNKTGRSLHNLTISLPENVQQILTPYASTETKLIKLNTIKSVISITKIKPKEIIYLYIYANETFQPEIALNESQLKCKDIFKTNKIILLFLPLIFIPLTFLSIGYGTYVLYQNHKFETLKSYVDNQESLYELKIGGGFCSQPYFYTGPKNLVSLTNAIPYNKQKFTYLMNHTHNINELLHKKQILLCKEFHGFYPTIDTLPSK